MMTPTRFMLPAIVSLAIPLTPISIAPAVADVTAGKAVFELKCAACHAGGGNAISPAKTLTTAALEANKVASDEALTRLVSNGKGQMPSYGPKAPPFGRLTEEQIADVVQFVQSQASAGWPS